ncbi:putative ribonuclease h protein [Quercus suber]|uniref:Ribonuclease h protein n=1 Tax=Quercus suber TaxID=58331 RepID=A0AAW0L6C3_QUESU
MDFRKYLGVPITIDGRNKHAFDFILDKVRARLSGWKAKSLSLASRMTLIASVTSSVPIHLMQCNLLPSRICTELDRLNRNFLWGDLSTKKKLHAINWDVVTKPEHLGGLGLKKSFPQNKSLLAKRAWAMHTNENTTWADTLRKKYLTSNTAKRKSTIWNNIQKSEPICKLGTRWLIRNDHSVKFWHDNWTRHGPLRILLRGPLHASDLHLKVKDTWDANGN